MLGTSDAWSMSRSSHRPSDPSYYIEDCRIFVYFYMSSHFQNRVLLPRLGDATSSKSIRTKTDREKACHDKNNSTVTEFIFLPQLQWESNAFIDSLMSKIRFGSSVILSFYKANLQRIFCNSTLKFEITKKTYKILSFKLDTDILLDNFTGNPTILPYSYYIVICTALVILPEFS